MDREQIKFMWQEMAPTLNELQRRLYAATLAKLCGYGGATIVHEVTGVALNTITAGKRDMEKGIDDSVVKIRRKGAGPKNVEQLIPDIQEKILNIVDANTYGDPEKILSWTTKSLRKICEILLDKYNISVSYPTIGKILSDMGYSKQTNRKMLQVGKPHPDRNAQFEYIQSMAHKFINSRKPVISVDTKKKELIGNFKNPGQEYRRKKDPRKVLDHDFPIKELGKISPYGIFNLNNNTGFVNLGTSHDTAEFAVESISRWWECLGKKTFPKARELLITCDSGGSNGYRIKLWKYQLFQFAKRAGLNIYVVHFPPGTSKWNKIEHRLFCYISKNWQGQPLIDVKTAINLIGSTTTKQGLKVICVQDDNVYQLAKKISDADYKSIAIKRTPPFDKWNYIILGRG
jgi:transposase